MQEPICTGTCEYLQSEEYLQDGLTDCFRKCKIIEDKCYKRREEGVGMMCRAMEEMREEAARDASREERLKAIKCMIRFKIPKDGILNEGYTEEEYEAAKRQEI